MTGAACAEPATKYAICPISCLGLQRVGMLLTCVEVKHLSEEQKELVSGLSAPSQLDVQETCRFLSNNYKATSEHTIFYFEERRCLYAAMDRRFSQGGWYVMLPFQKEARCVSYLSLVH